MDQYWGGLWLLKSWRQRGKAAWPPVHSPCSPRWLASRTGELISNLSPQCSTKNTCFLRISAAQKVPNSREGKSLSRSRSLQISGSHHILCLQACEELALAIVFSKTFQSVKRPRCAGWTTIIGWGWSSFTCMCLSGPTLMLYLRGTPGRNGYRRL